VTDRQTRQRRARRWWAAPVAGGSALLAMAAWGILAHQPRLPSGQVSASAESESATAGTLGMPANPADVGWWMPSTAELVIDGHVDLEGVGPRTLYEVRNLHPGATVVVRTADGREYWTIDGVRTYQKGSLPARLFRWDGAGARLVIITCGGPFDYTTHHYDDNVVAYGVPLRR
jgi:hypothetical protein